MMQQTTATCHPSMPESSNYALRLGLFVVHLHSDNREAIEAAPIRSWPNCTTLSQTSIGGVQA